MEKYIGSECALIFNLKARSLEGRHCCPILKAPISCAIVDGRPVLLLFTSVNIHEVRHGLFIE